MIKVLRKGFKLLVNEKIEYAKEYISNAQNRLILGLTLLGLGLGLGGALIISAYLRVE